MKLRPRHPFQFLVSLLAALLLWYVLAGQRNEEVSVRGVRAQLTLVNIPRDLVLTSSVPDTVAVQLRGPLSRALDPRVPLEVLLDLSDARPGQNSFTVDPGDIPLPAGVEVVSVEPAAISLELERQLTRNLPVRPAVEGSPATGFELGHIHTIPAQLAIQGPESRVAELTFVDTSPISIEGATGPVEATVQPRVVDPLLRMLTFAPVQVTVDIVPQPTPTPAPTPARRRRG